MSDPNTEFDVISSFPNNRQFGKFCCNSAAMKQLDTQDLNYGRDH